MEKNRTTRILSLPETVRSASPMGKMFWDIPLIGVDKRTYSTLRRVQRSRPRDFNSLWDDSELLPVKRKVDAVLRCDFGWPLDLFHPDDECEALFFYPFGDLGDVDGYMEIEDSFGEFFDLSHDVFRNMTYSELLRKLTATGPTDADTLRRNKPS